MTRELTRKSQNTLEYIKAYWLEHGHCPSHRKIAEDFRLSGPNASAARVATLIRHGLIRKEPGGGKGHASVLTLVPQSYGLCPLCGHAQKEGAASCAAAQDGSSRVETSERR